MLWSPVIRTIVLSRQPGLFDLGDEFAHLAIEALDLEVVVADILADLRDVRQEWRAR